MTPVLSTTTRRSPFAGLAAVASIAAVSAFGFRQPIVAAWGLAIAAALLLGYGAPCGVLAAYAASTFLEYVPVGAGIPVALPSVLGLFLLAAAALTFVVRRRPLQHGSRVPLLAGIMAAVYLMSSLLNPGWFLANPRGLTTYWALAGTVIAIWVVVVAEDRVPLITGALVAGGFAVALLTVQEGVTGHYNQFGLFDGADDRAYGVADPNYTAAMLVTVLPLAVAHALTGKRLAVRAASFLAVLGILAAIGMTASRGGALGVLAVAPCTLVWCSGRSRGSFGSRARTRLGVALIFAAGIGVAAWSGPSILWERLSGMQDQSTIEKESRLDIWSDYLGRWAEAPWFGHGPSFVESDVDAGREEIPHSTPVQILVETGLVGLLAYAALNIVAIRELLSARKRFAIAGRETLSRLSGALAAALIGFNVTGLFLTRASAKDLWVLLGMAAAVSAMSRAKSECGGLA